MIAYRDKTFCKGAGCQSFEACPRALTKEVEKGAQKTGLPISRFEFPEELDCYVAPDEKGDTE